MIRVLHQNELSSYFPDVLKGQLTQEEVFRILDERVAIKFDYLEKKLTIKALEKKGWTFPPAHPTPFTKNLFPTGKPPTQPGEGADVLEVLTELLGPACKPEALLESAYKPETLLVGLLVLISTAVLVRRLKKEQKTQQEQPTQQKTDGTHQKQTTAGPRERQETNPTQPQPASTNQPEGATNPTPSAGAHGTHTDDTKPPDGPCKSKSESKEHEHEDKDKLLPLQPKPRNTLIPVFREEDVTMKMLFDKHYVLKDEPVHFVADETVFLGHVREGGVLHWKCVLHNFEINEETPEAYVQKVLDHQNEKHLGDGCRHTSISGATCNDKITMKADKVPLKLMRSTFVDQATQDALFKLLPNLASITVYRREKYSLCFLEDTDIPEGLFHDPRFVSFEKLSRTIIYK